MPKYLRARAPHDDDEARKIRRLAGARHAPADWIEWARIIALSWDGLGLPAIAAEIGCHENTVCRWLHRFHAAGVDGLGNQPGAGRKRRITEAQRSRIIALARPVPPGQLARDAAGLQEARSLVLTNVHAKTTLTEPARTWSLAATRSRNTSSRSPDD